MRQFGVCLKPTLRSILREYITQMGAVQRVSELCPATIFDDDLYVLPTDDGEQGHRFFPPHISTSLYKPVTKVNKEYHKRHKFLDKF